MLTPAYLNYRLDKKWLEWFMRSSRDATGKINLDLAPIAVYEMLIFWNKQFSPGFARLLESWRNLDLRIISLLVKLEMAIIIFSFLLAAIMTKFYGYLYYSSLIFIGLFFIPGFLVGLEFPLAGKIYLKDTQQVGRVAGLLYGADLLGGWLAGILGGIILLPVLGLFNTCMVIVMLKVSSLCLLLLAGKQNL